MIGGKRIHKKEFDAVYGKWHDALWKACSAGLKATEYMHIRATLVVLSCVVSCFPRKFEAGKGLLERVAVLRGDARDDVKAMANAYHAQLSKAKDGGDWRREDGIVWRDVEEEKRKR